LLLEKYADALGEEGRGYAEQIATASKQMSILIEDLLTLAQTTRATMHLQTIDLSAETDDIAGELQHQEPDRDVRFIIQRPVKVRAEPALIRIVLRNLVENAWKYTSHRDDALIEFGTTPTSDAPTCCYLRDNGVGFDPSTRISCSSRSSGCTRPARSPARVSASPASGRSWNGTRAARGPRER